MFQIYSYKTNCKSYTESILFPKKHVIIIYNIKTE